MTTLTPAAQRLVDALARHGLTYTDEINAEVVSQVAEELLLTFSSVRSSLTRLRKADGDRTGNNASTDEEARLVLEVRGGTRDMLCRELGQLIRATAGGQSKAELRRRLQTIGAWVETL